MKIVNTPIKIQVLGVELQHDPARTYGEEIMGEKGLGYVWSRIPRPKPESIGRNVAVYDRDGKLIIGVECTDENLQLEGLRNLSITVNDHICYIQQGPYAQFPDSYAQIKDFLAANAWEGGYPTIEIYGHWEEDESKLTVEILTPFLKKAD